MEFTPKEIKLIGLKGELAISMAIVDAGGSTDIRPSSEVIQKAEAKLGGGNGLAVHVIEKHWIVLRGKRGLAYFHFHLPVKVV